ncbi:LamG domain-containing protein [Luteolibacter ambystomatis]|uniref:LamG domain-containing protein n=1 Tax=Luteolibacter ambystomatis TaxID=2824561 RepID=A0A975IZF6_9BACT|nr:LamG domain-containing protein [Luteolibacter ambystomatis]QUE51134.1 LamG domain-containing protein [Luteolibacter ambystomatis]
MKLPPLSSCTLLLLLAPAAHAIQDTNGNGMGDAWEKYFNGGSLFSAANTNHAATADPDRDGWTNAMEALAGTDPFKATAPTGHVDLKITRTVPDDLLKFSWLSQAGKVYQLETSPNLMAWSSSGAPEEGTGAEIQRTLGGPVDVKRFWRVKITDSTVDPDGDTLNAWEENALGTNPLLADTDGDNIPDNLDPYPTVNAALSDPDGTGVSAAFATGLKGFWDFESIQGATFADRSGSNRHATSFSGGPVRLGMPSQAARLNTTGYITIPPATVKPANASQDIWTASGWFRLGKDSIKNSNGFFRVIFSLYDQQGTGPAPNYATLAQGTCFMLRRTAAGQQWYVGGYRQYASDGSNGTSVGSPLTDFNGYDFSWTKGTADDGNWHHFAVTYAPSMANGQRVYLDGVLVKQVATQYYPVAYDTDTTFTFGRLYPAYAPSALPDAMLDRLRVHSRVLSATEVQDLFHQDADGDGLWDVTESRTVNWVDANSNGVVDAGEYTYVSSPYLWQAASTDHDGDGLTDLQEQTAGTDLTKVDTDGDLMPDGWEVTYGLNPLSSADAAVDTDHDGKTNLYEYQHGTNPTVPN